MILFKRSGIFIFAGIFLLLFGNGCALLQNTDTSSLGKDLEKSNKKTERNYFYAFHEATKQSIYGNYEQSLELYKQCIKANPDSDASYFKISRIYFIQDQMKKAQEYGRKAVDLDPDNFWYQRNLANIYQSRGKNDSLIKVYESIVNRFEEKPQISLQLVQLYFKQGDYEKCLELTSKLSEQYDESLIFHYYQSKVYKAKGQYSKAIDELRKIIELNPEKVVYHIKLANLLLEQGKENEALQTMLDLDKKYPHDYNARRSLADIYLKLDRKEKSYQILDSIVKDTIIDVEKKMKMVHQFISNKDTTKLNWSDTVTQKLVDNLKRMYPEHKMVDLILADYYIQNDSIEDATTTLSSIVNNYKVDYRIWRQLFYYQSKMENTDSVYKYAKLAIDHFNGRPSIYLFKGMAEKQMNMYDSALSSFDKGLELVEPDNKELRRRFFTYKGEVYHKLEKYQKSDSSFQKALNLRSEGNLYLLNNYSYFLALRGDHLDKALKLIEKCINTEPENPIYLDTYAWVLYKRGEYQKALKYIEKAVKNNEEASGEVLEHYGDILYKNGQEEKALKLWNKAKMHDDHSPLLEKKIQERKLIID